MSSIRDQIQAAELNSFLDLISKLKEEEVIEQDEKVTRPVGEVVIDDGKEISDVNKDIYEVGIISNRATLDDVIFKVNELVTYINKNLGV